MILSFPFPFFSRVSSSPSFPPALNEPFEDRNKEVDGEGSIVYRFVLIEISRVVYWSFTRRAAMRRVWRPALPCCSYVLSGCGSALSHVGLPWHDYKPLENDSPVLVVEIVQSN